MSEDDLSTNFISNPTLVNTLVSQIVDK